MQAINLDRKLRPDGTPLPDCVLTVKPALAGPAALEVRVIEGLHARARYESKPIMVNSSGWPKTS